MDRLSGPHFASDDAQLPGRQGASEVFAASWGSGLKPSEFPEPLKINDLVPYRLTLDTSCTKKIPSDHLRNDCSCGEAFCCGGGGTAGLGQIVAVRPGDALDHAEVEQSAQLSRQPVGGEHLKFGEKVGAADAGDVDPWILQRVQ